MTRNSDNAVLKKDNANNNAKIKKHTIDLNIPQYTASLEQQTLLSKRIANKTPTNLQYIKRCFLEQVKTQKLWTFELGTQERIKVSLCVVVGFQQSDREHDQNINKDKHFYGRPATSAQCIIGTEKDPDSAILLIYDDDDHSQGYGQIKEAFKALTKDDTLHPYIFEHDFRSTNDGNNIGYNLNVFDVRYQKNFEGAKPIKVEFKFSEILPARIYGYVPVLTNKLISVSSDGQRHFALI